MKITKTNIILIVLVLLMIIFEIYTYYGTGCSSIDCMGPHRVNFFGLIFIENILSMFSFIILILPGAILVFCVDHYFNKNFIKALNIAITFYLITFLILTILNFIWLSTIIY